MPPSLLHKSGVSNASEGLNISLLWADQRKYDKAVEPGLAASYGVNMILASTILSP
jgi:hypothetical protein